MSPRFDEPGQGWWDEVLSGAAPVQPPVSYPPNIVLVSNAYDPTWSDLDRLADPPPPSADYFRRFYLNRITDAEEPVEVREDRHRKRHP